MSGEEWENIPQIIPVSITALSRDIASLQAWVNVRETEESVPSLSRKVTQFQQQLSLLSALVNQAKPPPPPPQEKDHHELYEKVAMLEEQITGLSVKPEVREVQIETEMTAEHFVSQPEITLQPTEESEEAVEAIPEPPISEAEKFERDRPRLLSLNTFQKLVHKHLAKSRLKATVQTHDQLLIECSEGFDKLEGKIQEIIAEFQREIERVYAKFEQEEDRLAKICADISSKFKEQAHWTQGAEGRLTALKAESEKTSFSLQDLTDWYERTKSFLTKLDTRFDTISLENESKMKKEIEALRIELKQETTKLDRNLSDMRKTINEEMESKITVQKQEIQQIVPVLTNPSTEGLAELRADLEAQLADYRSIVESDVERLIKEQREEKNSATDLLRTHSVEIKKLRMELDKFVSAYVEPKQISDARLFATEARIREEEIQRLEDLHFLKDIVKKLGFSLEQNVLATLSQPRSPGAELDPSLTLFVKRLSFLKKIVQVPVRTAAEPRGKPATVRMPSPTARPRELPRLNRSMIQEGSESSFVTQGSILEHKYKDVSSGHTRGQSKEV
jgi:hypothetical protein